MERKLNIAVIGHKRIPSREGGIEIVVEELSTRTVSLGHKVTCFNRRGHHVNGKEYDRPEWKQDYYKGIILKKVFTIDKKGLAALTSSFSAAIKAAFGKYDVVHFHAEGPCAMLWLPKLFGKRCIATIHGLDWQRGKWGEFASKYIKFGEKCAAKYADEVIVLSHDAKDYFLCEYKRETRFIPIGIEKPTFRKAEKITEQYGLNGNDYILFFGRIVPEKGVRYLIEAYKNIKTDKKLVIAGGSSDTNTFYSEMQELAKGDNRIIFTGFIDEETVEELYSNAYIYTLPSDVEGMPRSLLVALSFGCCCFISDIPEMTEITKGNAPTFEKSNVEDLMRKLQVLCDDIKEVEHYKEQALSMKIEEHYGWDDVAVKTLALYKK